MSKADHQIFCPVCRSVRPQLWAEVRDVEYLTTDEKYFYYNCPQCQILFIDPMPVDQLKIIYPANYYSFNPAGFSWVERIKTWLDTLMFRKILKGINSERIAVLDVGGGSGWLVSEIKKMEPRVKITQIVDLDPSAAVTAEQRGHQYFCGRFEDFKTEQKFDLILLLNLIEHVENPSVIIKKCKGVLAPGGRILIKTPNFNSWDARIFRFRNWGGYHCPRHWVLFTKESFEKLILAAGLQVDSFQYTQGAPFWSIGICAWLAQKKIIRVTQDRPMFQHPLYSVLLSIFAGVDFVRRPFFPTSQMIFLLK